MMRIDAVTGDSPERQLVECGASHGTQAHDQNARGGTPYRVQDSSGEGSGAAATRTRRAGEAMGSRGDGKPGPMLWIHFPEVDGFFTSHMEPQHLIEVAIKKFSLVTDVEGGTAHQALQGVRIERLGQ